MIWKSARYCVVRPMDKTPQEKMAIQLWHIELKVVKMVKKLQDIELGIANILEHLAELRAIQAYRDDPDTPNITAPTRLDYGDQMKLNRLMKRDRRDLR